MRVIEGFVGGMYLLAVVAWYVVLFVAIFGVVMALL